MRRISYLAFLLPALLLSCARLADAPAGETVFRTEEAEPWTPVTRTLLTAPDIETRRTSVTLAAYTGGTLAASAHFTTGLDAMVLDLEPDRSYTAYALVNMGDMRNAFPLSESELSSITYRIPSYTGGSGSLAERGLPMAGKLVWPDQGNVIPLRRLVAKVTAKLSCDWPEAALRSVKICNLNRVLRPFGAAVRGEDWDAQELSEGTGTASGTFVFYVPENRQGIIDGIRESEDKSPDRTPEVYARKETLTYLETSVSSTTSPYAGSITYRSYLGGNATTDFDIERNALYLWNVIYHADRTQDQDWKRDGDIFTVQVTADKTVAYIGETVRLHARCHRSDHGTVTRTDVTKAALWSQSGDAALCVDAEGQVTATSPGVASFRATYSQGEWTGYGDSPVVTFRELPALSATWTAQATYVGQRGSFTIDGLVDGATISEVTSTDETVAVPAAVSGTQVFVNYIGATGSATLTVKASNGQRGTVTVFPAAPHLLDRNVRSGSTVYYGHPDGTDINTQASGHGGLPPSFGYYTGTQVTVSEAMSVGDDASPTKTYTGRTFAPDLYETLLKPTLTAESTARFGSDGVRRFWVRSLADYPTAGGIAIGELTAAPPAGHGVGSISETILSVNPFQGVTSSVTWPDFNDKGMLVQYVDCDDYDGSVQVPSLTQVNADAATVGWDVKLAGNSNAAMKALFTGNDNYLYFHYSEGDALPHIGGICEVQRTVTNPYSGERIGKTFLSFRIIVWGAVGGSATLISSSRFEVRPAYVGPSAVRPTGNLFKTSLDDGSSVTVYGPGSHVLLNGTVHYDGVGHSLGQAVYSVDLTEGQVLNTAQVYRSLDPSLLYPGYSDAFYRIELLEKIQTKSIHPDYHPGWIVSNGGLDDPPVD